MKFIFLLFLYPPIGHQGNAIIVEKYTTESACKTSEQLINQDMPTHQTRCQKIVKPD